MSEQPVPTEIEYGPPTAGELDFVVDAWLESFRKSPWAGCVRNDMYQATQRATIAGLLARGAQILVALAPRLEGVHEGRRVMGYAVAESALECLHWVYVKKDYRGHGLGRELVRRVAEYWTHPRYSHRTRASSFLPRAFRWDPVPARVARENAAERS